MRALLSKAIGGPDTLVVEEVAEPVAGAGEVKIAVRACAVNFPDVLIIEDKYQVRPPRPFSPGAEVAGVVEAVGAGVDGFAVGDRVIAWTGSGGMAEKLVAPAVQCLAMPDGMSFDEAAAFVMTYGTSHHALKDRAQLKASETLLVLGAAGGVGLAAVELGKAAGARVIAAVSSPAKAELALAHGADHAFVYPSGPFNTEGRKALSALFKANVGVAGADVIYDPVGGDYAEAALRSIGWEGRYLVVGFPAGIPRLPLNLTLLKSCQIVGVFWGAFLMRSPEKSLVNTAELLALFKSGAIRPEISARFPLARGGEAIALLASRQALGKVVVTID
ncbi:MAG: NADPH:quinone oxidoreductase family protein [Caulobacteraceae bacterium]